MNRPAYKNSADHSRRACTVVCRPNTEIEGSRRMNVRIRSFCACTVRNKQGTCSGADTPSNKIPKLGKRKAVARTGLWHHKDMYIGLNYSKTLVHSKSEYQPTRPLISGSKIKRRATSDSTISFYKRWTVWQSKNISDYCFLRCEVDMFLRNVGRSSTKHGLHSRRQHT